jgi:polar amino acid transport system substrate-binding protein
LQKLSADYCVKKGLKPIALSEYTTDPQTTQALLSRAVEAQITDAAVARGVIDKLATGWLSSETLIYPVLNGFGVKKGNSEVKTALEEGLKKYSATPEYAALLKKYNFQAPTPEDLQP